MRSLAVASEGLLAPQKKAELVDKLRTIMLPPTPHFDGYTEFLFSGRFIPPKQDFSKPFLLPGRIEHRSISAPVDIMLVSAMMPTIELFEMFENRTLTLSEYWSALLEEEKTNLETGFRNALVMSIRGYPALARAVPDRRQKKWRVEAQLRPGSKSAPEKRDASSTMRFFRFFVRSEAA
jgi:hypothetical protein